MKRLFLLCTLLVAGVACQRHPVSALENIEHGGHGEGHQAEHKGSAHSAAQHESHSAQPVQQAKFF